MQQHETSANPTWNLMKLLQRTSNPHLLHFDPVQGPLRGPTAIHWGGSVFTSELGDVFRHFHRSWRETAATSPMLYRNTER